MMEVYKDLHSQQIADSINFNKIKGLFTAEAKTITQYPVTANSGNILCNTYFNI